MNELDLAIRLVHEFFPHTEDMEGSISESALSIQEMKRHAPLASIEQWVRSWAKNNPHHMRHLDHIGQMKNWDTTNLIYSHTVGYHRKLRLMNKPNRLIYHHVLKRFIKEQDEYANKRLDFFSLQDLQLFWRETMVIHMEDKADLGRFRYLLTKYDLDLVLYAIDCLADYRKEEGKKSMPFVFDLEKFIPEAMERLEQKKNTIKREHLEWTMN